MKSFVARISFFILASVLIAFHQGELKAQTPASSPTPMPTPVQSKPASSQTKQQAPANERERRAQAYNKMLEGQRYLTIVRRDATAANLRRAQAAFQEAATLDPTLAEAHTALAEIAFYYSPQDFDTATREAESAERLDANNYGAHHLLSRLYTLKSGLREGTLNRQYVDLAIKELKEVTRLETKDAEAWALLGDFYEATGHNADALTAWTNWAAAPPTSDTRFYQYVTGRELAPDSAVARLAEVLFKAGRTTEALAAIRRAIALNPENTEYTELFGQIIEASGLKDSATIAELQRMVAADPTNISTVELLARVQSSAGHWDEAAATLRAAITQQKAERAQQMLRTALAQLYTNAARYTDAIAVYEEQLKVQGIGNAPLTNDDEKAAAARILERMIEVYKRMGHSSDVTATIERMRRLLGKDDPTPDAEEIASLREQGKRNEALQLVRAARQRHPDQTDFLRLEAETLTELGRIDEAVAVLRPLLKGSIQDFNIYLVISGLYLQAGRAADAVTAARKALELAPAGNKELIEEALIALSSAQERAGDRHGSEESLRRILSTDPNNATALNNLGYFLVERNERLTEALEMIQRAVRANPNNSSFLDSLGWAYFKLGKLDEAERSLTEAARLNSTSATIQEHLGDLYQQRGKPEQARAAWQKALSLTTEAQDTARLKAKLSGKTQR